MNIPPFKQFGQGQESYPYYSFGFFLWRLREAQGLRSEEVARYLGIPTSQYRDIESGKTLPSRTMQVELARMFKVDTAKLVKAILYSSRRAKGKTLQEEAPLEGAMFYSKLFGEGIEKVKKRYKELRGRDLDRNQLTIFGRLKNDLYSLFVPPLLPFTCLLILDTLNKTLLKKQIKYLHEITDFVMAGESLAGFVARELILGPFIFSAANVSFLHENPSPNIIDCMNRLTVEEFQILFLIAVDVYGIYTVEQELPILQQDAEFASLGAVMVCAMEPCLPKNIDLNYLYMAVLCQGLGKHVLYTTLTPSLKGRGEESLAADDEQDLYAGLDEELFNIIVFELHPTVSAMVLGNWRMPAEVREVLVTHHHHPVSEVSPLCAALKLVNFFVDCDFPSLSKEDLVDLLKAYPQVEISVESLFEVSIKMQKLKQTLMERSSTMAEDASQLVATYVSNKLDKIKDQAQLIPMHKMLNKRTDIRFDQGFLKAAATACLLLIEDLRRSITYPRKNEGIAEFQDRVTTFHFLSSYIKNRDLSSLVQRWKVELEEIQRILKIKT